MKWILGNLALIFIVTAFTYQTDLFFLMAASALMATFIAVKVIASFYYAVK